MFEDYVDDQWTDPLLITDAATQQRISQSKIMNFILISEISTRISISGFYDNLIFFYLADALSFTASAMADPLDVYSNINEGNAFGFCSFSLNDLIFEVGVLKW